MNRGRPGQVVTKESADGDRIIAKCGNATLAGDVLEEAHHEHLEIDDGVNARTAPAGRRISGGAEKTGLRSEPEGLKSLVEFDIKRGSGRPYELRTGDEQFRWRQ